MAKEANSDVLIIGGGIAGMQSALLLAEKGHRIHVVENTPAIGGFFPLLDRTFPTNSCGVCFMSPKPPAYCPIYEINFHENIELLTNCHIREVKGGAGDFLVSYTTRPKYVDMAKCNLCHKCTEVCPIDVPSELGGGLENRKAIYLPFAQAIPRSYVIDDKTCTKCGECVKVCSPGAVDLADQPRESELAVGAIVLGFGFEPFQGGIKGEYGFGRYENVLSSIQYERMLSFSGPTRGIPQRLGDRKKVKKVAIIQCVGSRDPSCGQAYCSSICCMYATKQAMVSKERAGDLDVAIFYMDIRAMGKDYERYYDRAKDEYGVRYINSAVSSIKELQQTKNLLITYGLENGELKEEEFDMVVLSVGLTPPPDIEEMAEKIGVQLNEYKFCETAEFTPTQTSVPGIFVAGAFREPRDIPETVVEACSAADDVSLLLDSYEEYKEAEEVSQEELVGDEPLRVGIFICDSNSMLSQELNLEEITGNLKEDPDVACIETIDVGSVKQGLSQIEDHITQKKLNRAVIAGYKCMEISRSVEKLPGVFGIYSNLYDCANVGEQCSSVHAANPSMAAEKARSLIQASIDKLKHVVPRKRGKKKLCSRILVIGGGISGLSSSLSLADQGMDVTLVEKDSELGGNARSAYYTLKGSDVQGLVKGMVNRVEEHAKIEVLKGAELDGLKGSWGDYHSVVSVGEEKRDIHHGAVIFAVGGRETKPEGYLYGESDCVKTQREFESMLIGDGNALKKLQSVVMIQCVGSRDEKHPYCSRVCCSHAVKNALKLKELNPDVSIYVLYRDIRTYGFYERYYHQIRDKGTIFIQYEPDDKPDVRAKNGRLEVSFNDRLLGQDSQRMTLDVDLLVLSTGIEPYDNRDLARIAGVELNVDGFFAEANPKSAPLDSVDRGKYFCGLCHSPNFIEDSIAQAKGAASRASALLWSGVGEFSDNQVFVNERLCSGCGICVSVCPYNARVIEELDNKAKVLEDLCKGCGTCAIACPNGASQQWNFERTTVFQVLDRVLT